MELFGKRVLVLGLGESGLAMARWCDRQGVNVRVLDTRVDPPYLVELREAVPSAEFYAGSMNEGFDKRLLDDVDLLALSPGLSAGTMAVISCPCAGFAGHWRNRTLRLGSGNAWLAPRDTSHCHHRDQRQDHHDIADRGTCAAPLAG